jgi:hypothetical protein
MKKENFMKKTEFDRVAPSMPKNILPQPTLADLLQKRAKLEQEMAYAMALETFLDCDYQKIKVSKKIAKTPKAMRGTVRGKIVRVIPESLKGTKPVCRTSNIFN